MSAPRARGGALSSESDRAGETDLELARKAARDAAAPGALAVARVEERHRTRFWLDSRHEAAQGSSVAERTLVVRVSGSEGVRSREALLAPGPSPLGGLGPHELWRAALEGLEAAARGQAIRAELRLAVTFESVRLALASSGAGERDRETALRSGGDEPTRPHARASLDVAIEGELRVAGPRGTAASFRAAARLDPGGDLAPALVAAREAARDTLARATARARRTVALPPRAKLALLSPDVLTWVLHGPIVEGVRGARPGAAAEVPRWLEVHDGGALEPGGEPWPDEEGLVAGSVPLVALGRWQRGPFRPFDGTGRTRRDRMGELSAELASVVTRVVADRRGFLARKRALEARADLALTEVASADPLPGGGAAIVAHALVRTRGRWAPAGLASVRLRGRTLWPRCAGASVELEPAWAQRLPLRLPWLLVRGLTSRPAL